MLSYFAFSVCLCEYSFASSRAANLPKFSFFYVQAILPVFSLPSIYCLAVAALTGSVRQLLQAVSSVQFFIHSTFPSVVNGNLVVTLLYNVF